MILASAVHAAASRHGAQPATEVAVLYAEVQGALQSESTMRTTLLSVIPFAAVPG